MKKRSVIATSWKVLLVFISVAHVLWDVFWKFGKLDEAERKKRLQQWAYRMLNLMEVNLNQQQHKIIGANCLRAANHVSWLDIIVLYACEPCRFIAKSEVENYPLIGRIATNAGTLFLKRGSIKDAIRMSETISTALKQGDCVAFFPEGTTSHGEGLLPLHPSLFEGAIHAESYVQSATLRFHTQSSTRAAIYASYVENSMFGTLWNILRHGPMQVTVTGGEPFKVAAEDTRQDISLKVRGEMEQVLKQLTYDYDAALWDEVKDSIKDNEQYQLFITDAARWLKAGKNGFDKLTQSPENKDAMIDLRQGFHYLKGANCMRIASLGEVAQSYEESIDTWIRAKKSATPEFLSIVGTSLTELKSWHELLEKNGVDHDANRQAQVVFEQRGSELIFQAKELALKSCSRERKQKAHKVAA